MLSLKIVIFALLATSLLAATKTVVIGCGTCAILTNCTTGYKCYQYASTNMPSFESCVSACPTNYATVTVTLSNCTYDYKAGTCANKVCAYIAGSTGITIGNSLANGDCDAFAGSLAITCAAGTLATASATECATTCTSCYKSVKTTTSIASAAFCASTSNQTCVANTITISVTKTASGATGETFIPSGSGNICQVKYVFTDTNQGVCINDAAGTALMATEAIAKLQAWTSEGIVVLSALLFIGSFML